MIATVKSSFFRVGNQYAECEKQHSFYLPWVCPESLGTFRFVFKIMYYIVCVFSKKSLNAPSFCFVLFGVPAWGSI